MAAFRRARCAGRAPVAEAHRVLLNAVVRYGPKAGLMGAAQTRLSELWAAAGCQVSVFASARPPERPAEALRLSVIGRALLGEPGGDVRNPQRRPREVGNHPVGPPFVGLSGENNNEDSIKRRRVGGSSEDPRPSGQGPVDAGAAGSAEGQLVAQVPLRSSALGRALLRSSGIPERRSLLGEADNAEGRLLLKRRKVVRTLGLELPCSQGALDALAACRGVEVASAIAAWPSGPRDQVGGGGSSSSGPSGSCWLSPR